MQAGSACIRIVEDEPAVLSTLQTVVESIGFTTRLYDSAERFISEDCLSDHGCVLMDLGLKGMSGIELVRWINHHPAPLPIVVVTGQGSIQMAVDCLKSGAIEFLQKPVDIETLLKTVRDAVATDAGNCASRQLLADLRNRYSQLSSREQEVLRYLADGLSTKQIAAKLNLSSKTIEHHRASVMQKMQSTSLAEVVRAFVMLEIPL